ncbi:hypothetical protein K505DRAFT_370800 [Melanomma pulvis-pyrius CBS 109.77]|uniref:Uncharacterized protein n=1 Tax=Melanomma pulvis-pyrius CBS 109.77 TaxID=1314802 RepID=A0A6A6XU34_9PLEO|nr:hypothetical protein K505DRAFT_370800 [Melanomma pulvis-pyrius CBS 109.77]
MEANNSTPTPALRGRPRLHELATTHSVPLSISLTPLLSSTCPTYMTDADRERANALLIERRTVDPEYKAPKAVSKFFKKKAEIEAFSQKEVNRALAAVVTEGGSPGLADALLEFGGDVNVARKASKSTWKKITRSDQQDRRSDLLPKAVQGGNVDIVRLLASRADHLSLDEALSESLDIGQLDVTRILLEYGADPAEFHEQFLSKISEGREDVTELLMRGPKRPCLECRAKGLIKAIEMGSLKNTTILMLNEADADYQQGSAFQLAVKSGRNDLAIALATGQKPPSPSSLDMGVSTAYTSHAHDLGKMISLIEICLCGSARGEHMAETLLKAVEEKQAELVDLLLVYEASVDYEGGAVIKHAILDGQNELMLELLKKKPSPISLSNAIDSAMTLSDLSIMHHVIMELLIAGVVGDAVNQALITAVKLSPDPHAYKIIQLLLDRGGADVNFQEGKALQLTAASGAIGVLQLLLATNPIVVSVNAAFPFAMEIQDVSKRHAVAEMLLQAGATGLVVDQALVNAAEIGTKGIPLVTLLLSKASVDFENGKALCEAIKIRCFELIQTLVTVKHSLQSLTAAWAEATVIDDDEFQFRTFQILLEVGMEGDSVGRSLVVATTKGSIGLDLCKLLLKYGASVDYNNGEAMVIAVQHSYIDILELLLSGNPSKGSLTPALAAAQALKEEERLAAVTPILKIGVAQEVCDAGLLQAVKEQPSDSRLIQLFLDAKGSPDFSDGSSILHAARTLNVGLLKMLAPSINSREAVSNAFGVVFQSTDKRWRSEEGLAFIELLIGKGAAGEYVNKAAVQAALMFDIDALELIAEPVSPASVFSTAFTEATRTRDDWVSPEGLTVVQFLLEKGVSGSDVYEALNKAASTFNFEALQLLSTVMIAPEAYTAALGEAIGAGEQWLLRKNQDVIDLLLEHDANGETLHMGLLEALDAYHRGTTSESLIDLLLHYNADVNYNKGEALQLAASSGDDAILKKLLGYGATLESISLAFSMAIASQHEEKRLFALLDAFMHNPVEPDVNFVYPDLDPPLILSMELYPESAAIAKRMCDMGCNIEKEVTCEIYDDELQGPEVVTPLAWALSQPDNMISTDVIAALLESNANPNYATNVSKTTPLHIAAKSGRSEDVTLLLKHGAKVSARDAYDRSALFYASRNGDAKTIASILKAKPGPNDGSLQEAARELHAPAIKLLIKGGHHPDFTSSKHDGRTALAELALCCASSPSDDRINDTIDALSMGNVDPLKKCRGKNPLYLSLENPEPLAIVQKLLERIYWKYVNDPNNLYIEDNILYSPTMYVTKGFLALSEADTGKLLKLLRDHETADVYYASEGQDQPPDAIGMPEKIAEFERKRKAREEKLRQQDEDHQRALMREAEAAGLKAQIKTDEQERKLQAIDAEQTLKFNHSAAANRQRLEALATQKRIDAQAAQHKLAVQKEATNTKLLEGQAKLNIQRQAARVKAVEGNIKVQQHIITQRSSAHSKLVQHKIKMEEMQAKRQMAQMKRLKG